MMLKKFLVEFLLFSEIMCHALGKRRTLQPYGPKMCDMVCEGSKGCSGHIFDEIQLTCQFFDSETTSTYTCPSNVKDLGKENSPETKLEMNRKFRSLRKQDKKITNKKKSGQVCTNEDFIDMCGNGKLEEVKRLVCQGKEDINCKDDSENTCVLQAAISHKTEMFDFLVQNGCDLSAVDEDKSTVLHLACLGGNMYIVKMLVDVHKLDIHWQDEYWYTPLFYAKNVQVVKFLKNRGANFKAIAKDNNTVLHVASLHGRVDVVKYVLSLNIIGLECKGENGKTPLMMAVARNRRHVIDILYTQHNASLTLTDDLGNNVLHSSVLSHNLEMVKYLITHKELRGFTIKKNKVGLTPVQFAKRFGEHEIANLLKSWKN